MSALRIAVAYSGGRDSTALLHATLAVAADRGVAVIALHVHHGLSANSDDWLAHCETQCGRWARAGKPIEFAACRLAESPLKGDSVEAWARQARYRALRDMALACGALAVLLAHHQRDQAETFWLQALRGAGFAGLSGMPRSAERDGILWLRPWLDRSRADIEAYARRHRLRHVDDDSNADARFARNRLRLKAWPAMVDAFEHAEASLATSARWAQQASALLDEVAQLDLAAIASAEGLRVTSWMALSPARRSNALRAWIHRQHGAAAPASLIARLLEELPLQGSARWPLFDTELRLYRGLLSHRVTIIAQANAPQTRLSIRRAGDYEPHGWAGTLRVERVREGGVPLAWLGHLELRLRAGGEQFQAGSGRPPRSLKKQFQSFGVPAWDRKGPLFYSGGHLIFVPGLGLDARVIGLPGQPLVMLRWLSADDVV